MFITFEGGEGAGKTTLLQKIARVLADHGLTVVTTREPGGTPLGDQIRQWVLDRNQVVNIGQKAELFLFLAARAQHIEELIAPSLALGEIVLCDRFNDSTLAYQGGGRGLTKEKVESLCDIACEKIVPGLTFYLDLDPAIGLERTKKLNKENAPAGDVDRMEAETLDFHRRVRASFLEIAERHPERIVVLDANRSREEVFQQALNTLKQKLKF